MFETETWLLASVLFYCLVVGSAGIYIFFVRRASIFEPIGQYFCFFSLFTLPLPIRALITQEIEGDVTPHLPLLMPYMAGAVFLAASSFPLFVVGYYSGLAKKIARAIPQPPGDQGDHSLLAFVFLFCISAALIYMLVGGVDGLSSFLLMGYGASSLTFGKGYLAVGFPWMFVASLFLLYRFTLKKTWLTGIFFVLVSLIVFGMQLLTGNRSMILYMGLTILIYFNYAIKKISMRVLVVLAVSAFISLNFVGYLRSSNYDSFGDFFEKTVAYAGKVLESDSKGEGFFYTLTIGEFVVPFETLPQIMKSVGTDISPMYGETFLRAPLFVIPSVLFPERPLPIGNWYMEEFYGKGYGLNEGRQFYYISEGYLNFGLLGALLLVLAWGIMWGALHQYMLASRRAPGAVMLYALSVAFMFRCIAGDFVSLTIGLPQQSLSAAIMGLLIATGFRRWRALTRTR